MFQSVALSILHPPTATCLEFNLWSDVLRQQQLEADLVPRRRAISTQPTRLRRRLPGQALTVPRWAGRGVRRPLERPIPRLRAVVREVQRPAARRVQIEGAIPCS